MPDKLKLTLVALLTSGVLQASDGDSYDPMEIDDAPSSDAGQPITKFFAENYDEKSLEPLMNNTALEKIKIKRLTHEVRLPESLGDLHNLKKIEICETRNLCGPLPKSFTALQNLTYFDVSDNNLVGEIPEGLVKLENLVHLDLSSNKLEGKIPEFLSNLTKLTHLSLGYNHFVGKIPEGLSALENLDFLSLSQNNLSGQFPRGINLLKIETFLIHGNPGLYGNIEDFLNQEQIEKQGLKKDLEYDFSETAFFGQLSRDILKKGYYFYIHSTFINQPGSFEYVYNTFLSLKNTYDPKKEDFNDKARKALNGFYNQLDQDQQDHFVSQERLFEISRSFFNSYMNERKRAPNPRRP